MKIIHFIFPGLSALVLILVYIIIISSRLERSATRSIELLASEDTSRDRERLWWYLSLLIVLMTYASFVILFERVNQTINAKNYLAVGFVIWAVLVVIGKRITQ